MLREGQYPREVERTEVHTVDERKVCRHRVVNAWTRGCDLQAVASPLFSIMEECCCGPITGS